MKKNKKQNPDIEKCSQHATDLKGMEERKKSAHIDQRG